jgi:ADP-ribose pyrophosphatase
VPEPAASSVAWSGRYLTVDIETWPGIGEYEIVRKHDAVAVVAVTPGGEALLVKQFRPPVRTSLLEIPAGLLDLEGEDALTCAERELREETGHTALETHFLGGTYLSPGFTAEYVHFFWARARAEADAQPEPGIEVVSMPLHRAVAAAREGKVRNAMTALGLLLAAATPALRDAATSPS